MTTVCLIAVLVPGKGYSQVDCKDGAGYECTYDLELEGRKIQKVPNAFKFQAKISQAKLPVGDVTFPAVFVKLVRGDTQVCEEELNNVVVRDSVLNMEIGRGMSNCNLDEIIANSNDIGIDVCIQNRDNCLKRVKLSTVPYAVKSSFANTAQKAHTANEAVQCNYAHRLTADKDLFVSQEIGKGYYDFHTPAEGDLDLLNTSLLDDDAQSVNGGYIQWTPVDAAYPNLHITAKNIDSANQKPSTLKELILHAEKTKTAGVAIVYGDQTSGTYDLIVHGDAQVVGNHRVEGTLEVANGAALHGDIVIGVTPDAETMIINHEVIFNGHVTIPPDAVSDKQARVSGTCGGDMYIQEIKADGSVLCGDATRMNDLLVDTYIWTDNIVVYDLFYSYGDIRTYGDVYASSVYSELDVIAGHDVLVDRTVKAQNFIEKGGNNGFMEIGSENAHVNIRGSMEFDCPNCGSEDEIIGTSNWGDLVIQGRILSASNNMYLSPPGGKKVFIRDNYRSAGGSETKSGASLEVEGTIYYNKLVQASDRRLKDHIETLPEALDVISRLRGVSFTWKEGERSDDTPHYGLIAQEVQEVLPHIVGADDGHLNVSYIELVPYLIEAVKEQQRYIDEVAETCEMLPESRRVDMLERKAEEQEEINKDLRARLAKMQAQLDALIASR